MLQKKERERSAAILRSLISGYQRLAARGAPVAGPSLPGSDSVRQASPLQIAQNDLARLQTERTKLVKLGQAQPDGSCDQSPDFYQPNRCWSKVCAHRGSAKVDNEPGICPHGASGGNSGRAPGGRQLHHPAQEPVGGKPTVETIIKNGGSAAKAVIAQYQSRLNLTPVHDMITASFATTTSPSRITRICSAKSSNRNWRRAWRNSRMTVPVLLSRPVYPTCLPVRNACQIWPDGCRSRIVPGLGTGVYHGIGPAHISYHQGNQQRFGAPSCYAVTLPRGSHSV